MFLASGFVVLGPPFVGGAEGARTPDPRLAKPVLSQLSYNPSVFVPAPAPDRLIAIVASLLRQTLAHAPNLKRKPFVFSACLAWDFSIGPQSLGRRRIFASGPSAPAEAE